MLGLFNSFIKKRRRPRVKMVAYFHRDLTAGDIGYESGQPSIIEGQQVVINAPNIVRNPIEAGNGINLNNGGAIGRTLLSSTSVGANKGTGSTNGQVQGAGNTLLSRVSSSFNGNTQINGSTNLNSPVNNGTERAVQIAGNNSGIRDIKNTGRINVNPVLSSAMFTANMNPSSRYLMETRSKYINLGQYFGSDYFTSRVGYSEIWDRAKRLGDAYYENQLLTRALAEKLGTAFINGKSNQELIQAMMDNASTEGTRLGLTVGQELTQEQINSLNEDIVWYVTKNVNGVEVLAPQVYLSSRTRESISDDTRNKIGGTEGTYVWTDNFVNNGTKWGNGGTTYVNAKTVRNETATNLLSEITGDRTFIHSDGNIENIGGRISGNEVVALISDNGKVINDTTKRTVGHYNGEFDRTRHEEVKSLGTISSQGTVFVKGDSYESTGGMLSADHLALDVNKVNLNTLSFSGEDKFGSGGSNFNRYAETTHLGAGVSANTSSGTVGDMNLKGSSFIAEDTTGLTVTGNVKVESAVNSYENESRSTSKGFMSSSSSYRNSHTEENSASNLMLGKNAVIKGNLEGIGSNIVLGENTYVGGKVTTDSRQLHNSYFEENRKKGFSGGISRGTASLNYGKSQNTYDEKSTVNAKSNLQIGDGSVLNRGAEITATNFEYGNIQINNGDVKYGARIDTRDVRTESKSSSFGISAGVNSPILDRAKQVAGAVEQVKNGDTAGGAMEAINAATGIIKGLADNQGTRQTNYDANGSVGKQGVKNASANNNFYANIGVNAGISKSKSTSNSHTESAVVTTMKPLNENSSITYNNVNNIMYQGTQAQGGIFIYNNVANIQKEAVELHNSYTSSSSSRGINAGATIGYGHKIQTTGNGGSISVSRSNQNTVETIHANGSFTNVNEVHNNTGTMTLSGFNQEGGKVTGNIGKVEVISRQNTSTTTGSSKGVNLGISANGVPSSVTINASRTNGNRAFVDNQSTFVVGEGSNLHVGTVENTGAVIGKEGNSTFKIDSYVGKDIQNYDTMTTTGGSIGVSLGGKPRITNVGFNQDSRDRQGITRNTVVGDVEITKAEGNPINRDLGKANEITKDTHSSTNINIESQTIEYATNPGKLKEDIGKAKEEINDIKWAIKESIHDRGDDNRNFFGQLSEVRLNRSLENITGERLIGKTVDTEIAGIFKDAYKDLGYDINIIFSDPKNSPQLLDEKGKPKTGTAYVRDEKVKKIKTIIINGEDPKNATKAGLIGTIVEEGSHVIGKVEGRQRKTGTDEKGLESTGRASNEYFAEKYKDDNPTISIQSDGKDYSNVDFGENVGDKKNEGWNIYQKDLRKEGHTQEEIQNNLYWWFGKNKNRSKEYSIDVKWDKYKTDKQYQEMINYYYYQAKKSLRIKNIKKDGDRGIIVSDGKKNYYLTRVPDNEAIYHNMYYDEKNKKMYFYLDGRNKKYVNEDRYEVILDKNDKVVYDPLNTGTYNFYTYKSKFSEDAIGHGRDFTLWVLYGTGPDDPTNKNPDIRKKIGDIFFGLDFQARYQELKNSISKTKISYEELYNIMYDTY